jgi:hypothetical protein
MEHTMNRTALALSALLISLAGTGTRAADLNAMMKQAGDWEMTMTGGMMPTMTQHGCYAGNKSIADLTNRGMKNCSQQSVSVSGGMATVNAVCQMQKMTVTVQSTVHATGSDSFHADSRVHLEGMPAIPGIPADINMSVDAHRTGPCTPGEKPL